MFLILVHYNLTTTKNTTQHHIMKHKTSNSHW